MRILEAEPPPEPSRWPKYLVLVVVLALLVGGLLWWQFRYYEEKQAVERFMEALQAGEYRQAYQLWGPSDAYPFKEFMLDWGPTTALGEVRTYEIVGVEEPGESVLVIPERGGEGRRTIGVDTAAGASGVIVLVRINQRAEPVRLWVEKDDLSLDFPPF